MLTCQVGSYIGQPGKDNWDWCIDYPFEVWPDTTVQVIDFIDNDKEAR